MNVPNFRKIDLVTYKPGRSLLSSKKKVIKLSANESAFGAGERVRNVLKNRNDNISKYLSLFFFIISSIKKNDEFNFWIDLIAFKHCVATFSYLLWSGRTFNPAR